MRYIAATGIEQCGPGRRAYTIRGFAEAFGIGKSKIWEMISAGRIEARRIGRRVVIDCESADRWYASLPKIKTTNEDEKTPC